MTTFERGLGALVAAGCLTFQACDGTGPAVVESPSPSEDAAVEVPAEGTSSTLDVATWNIQFFGSAEHGPTDDEKQVRRVRDILLGTEIDLWGVQEIAGRTAFLRLLDGLPAFAGLLADDPSVAHGRDHYGGPDEEELKVGIVYRSDVVQVVEARIILTDLEFAFAGRPPLEARVRAIVEGIARDLTVVVLHAKADAEPESWQRRADAARGLRDYLDARWADDPVLVIGDWNDDIDASITSGRESPYRPFVDAAPSWVFVTAPLTAAGETSILGFDDVIDHILASDESRAWYEPASVKVVRLDGLVDGYRRDVSDHLPVLARFRLSR